MNEIALRLAAKLLRLIQNQFRSAYIEAMIEPYLEPDGWRYVGDGWSGWGFERGAHVKDRLEVKQGDKNATGNIFGSYRLHSSGNGIGAAISPFYG